MIPLVPSWVKQFYTLLLFILVLPVQICARSLWFLWLPGESALFSDCSQSWKVEWKNRKKVQKKQGGPHRRGDSLGAGLQLEPEASEGTRTWIQPSRSWDNVRGDSPGPRTSRKSKSQSLEEEWRSSAATSLCFNRSKVSAASSSWFQSWDDGFILQQDLAAPQMDPPPRRAVKGAPTKFWGPNRPVVKMGACTRVDLSGWLLKEPLMCGSRFAVLSGLVGALQL